MPGRTYLELLDLAADQYGLITTVDAEHMGLDPAVLRVMHERGTLERVDRGVYRFPTIPATRLDAYMQATLWPRVPAYLSHETALDLYELCDVNPAKIHITLPDAYRLRRKQPTQYVLHPRNLETDDVTLFEGIPCVTPARAIRDGMETHLGNRLLDQAIETALARGLLKPEERRLLGRLLA